MPDEPKTETPPADKKPAAKPDKTETPPADKKPAAEAKEPTVTYHSPVRRVKLVRKATYDDATADLHSPETGELVVSRCPLSKEPREGFYTVD